MLQYSQITFFNVHVFLFLPIMVPNHTSLSARCPCININIIILCFLIINIGYLVLQGGQKITLERVEKSNNGRNNTRIIQIYKKEHQPSQSLEYIYNHYNNEDRKFYHWKEYASHYDFHLKLLLKMLHNSKKFRMLEKNLKHCVVFSEYILSFFLTGVYFCSEWCSWHQVLIEGDIDCMIYSFHWHKADSKSCGSKRMNLRWNISTPSGYCDFQISFP